MHLDRDSRSRPRRGDRCRPVRLHRAAGHPPPGRLRHLVRRGAHRSAAAVLDAHGRTTLVLPVVPFGPTPEHRNFGAGYVDLPVSVHDAVARATPGSLAEQGFAAVVVWRGCGGHDLRDVVFELRATWAGRTSFDLPDAPFAQLWAEFGDLTVAGGHADSFDVHLPVPPARGGSDGPPCRGRPPLRTGPIQPWTSPSTPMRGRSGMHGPRAPSEGDSCGERASTGSWAAS